MHSLKLQYNLCVAFCLSCKFQRIQGNKTVDLDGFDLCRIIYTPFTLNGKADYAAISASSGSIHSWPHIKTTLSPSDIVILSALYIITVCHN